MALRQKDLTPQITGTNASFTLKDWFYDPGSTVILANGVSQAGLYGETAGRQVVVFSAPVPLTVTSLICYFNDDLYSPLPGDLDVATLKSNYLFGIDLKDGFGNVMTDPVLGNKITIGLARAQRELRDFSITPQIIKSTLVNGVKANDGSWVVTPEPAAAAVADILEAPYDYDVNDYINWGFLTLRRRPIISVERIRLIYPTGQTIIQYPNEWIKIYNKMGQINIVPMAGSFNQYPLIGQGAMYLPLLSGYLTKNIPQLIHVDYTAGMDIFPDDLKDAIYKLSACEVLKQIGLGKAPGVASMSTGADGLSESTTLTQSGSTQMFGPIIKQYEDDAKAFLKLFFETQKGGPDFRVA